MAEEDPTTDEILAAFRSRRAAKDGQDAPTAATATAGGTPSEDTASDTPASAPTEPVAAPQDETVTRGRSMEEALGTPPLGTRPAPAATAPTSAVAVSSGLRPAVQAGPSGGGGIALSAASPALNLSSRLLEDRFLARGGSPALLATGVALALLGLVVVAVDQALVARGTALAPFNTDLTSAGLVLAALGLLLAAAGLTLPRRRSLRIRLAGTQREEWARVQADARRLRAWSVAGALLALLGLAGAAAAYAVVLQPEGGYLAAAFGLVAAVGIAVLAWSAARRSLVQRLYVQTLVLSRLEQTGLGPAAQRDPRIAPVLRSLDRLLGALPESAVRRFLHSDEAVQYLELLDDLARESARGR